MTVDYIRNNPMNVHPALSSLAGTAMKINPPPAAPTITVHFRPYLPSDKAFIYDTWAQSYRHCSLDSETQCDPEIYKIEIRHRMDRLIPRSNVIIGCDPDKTDVIRCYVVFEKPKRETQLPVLHYMLVRTELQNRGLGRRMVELVRKSAFVEESFIYASHWTRAMRYIGPNYGVLRNNFCTEV